MVHIYHIRYEYNEKGKSIRQIARETGHDRETVKRHIEQEDFCMPMRVKKTPQHHRYLSRAGKRMVT